MATETTVELDAQYRQLREECGLLDRSARGKLLVSGPDAVDCLQGQLTNDIEALEPGGGCYAALLDRKGHMQADMRVLRPSGAPYATHGHIKRTGSTGAEIWIDTEPEATEAARRHLETYKVGREVEIADLGDEMSILSLIGPRSAEIAGSPSLGEYQSEPAVVAGIHCLAVGSRDGIDLIAASADAQRLREALLAAGAPEVSAEAAEILRIEAGVPRFGAEMGPETMPAEAGIVERAVSFDKGCYIGQEPVARLHYKGRPNRHLRGLRLSERAEPGATLRLGEREVGRLGSSCVSPSHGPIGLTIVRREAEPGAEIAVGEDGVTARLVELPFE
jgi:tRNA-modifying protein YgfZ